MTLESLLGDLIATDVRHNGAGVNPLSSYFRQNFIETC